MKYLNIILTLLAIILGFIAFRLIRLEYLSALSVESSAAIVGSNQALINSSQRLEASFDNLRNEIADLKAGLPRK